MKTYHGSCHCGRVKFIVNTIIDRVVFCNCSICTKKGVLHHTVTPDRFSIIEGNEDLSLYQFDTKQARHFFCKVCGIQPFSNPRAAPEMVSINVNCLDDFDPDTGVFEIIKFDGRNREESIKSLNEQLITRKTSMGNETESDIDTGPVDEQGSP